MRLSGFSKAEINIFDRWGDLVFWMTTIKTPDPGKAIIADPVGIICLEEFIFWSMPEQNKLAKPFIHIWIVITKLP